MIWVALYVALTIGCCSIVFEAYRHDPVVLTDLRTAAIIILVSLILSIADGYLIPHPEQLYPFMDCVCAAFFLFQWRSNLKWWAMALFIAFIFDMGEHVRFDKSGDHSSQSIFWYQVHLNIIYVIQLCIVTAPAFVAIIQRQRERAAP